MKNFKAFYMLLCIVLCSCAFCFDLCHASDNTVKPQVYENALKTSVQRYVVYPYKKDKILCEPYRVSKDDWLYKIFREKGEISENDFPLFINIFKSINPGINDIDAIRPGQRILIPLKKIHKNDFKETKSGVIDVPVIEFAHVPETLQPFMERYKIKKGDTVSKLLNTVFLNKDGTLNTIGIHAFKLVNPNIKNVNIIYAGSFINIPIASICLQPWFRSSSITADIMQLKDKKARDKKKIEKISGTDKKARTIDIQKNITKSRYSLYGILKAYAAMVKGKPLQTGKFYFPGKNNQDFILDLKTTPVIELANGGKILIVPDKKTGDALSSVISVFWKDLKVLTVSGAVYNLKKHNPMFNDKYFKVNVPGNKLLRLAPGEVILPVNNESAVKKLLGLTDFHYIPDSQISLSMGDVHFNVSLGRIHKKGMADILVDFGTIYGYAIDLIKAKGFKFISFSPKRTFMASLVKLFTDLGMTITRNPVFVSTRTKEAITIHGLYVTGNVQNMLISEREMDNNIIAFLNRKKIKLLYLNKF